MASAYQPGLIDTNVLVDAIRNHPPALVFLGQATAGGLPEISVVTALELISGVRNAAELRGLQRSLSGYTIHPITPTISFATRTLLETFTLQVRLGMADAFIAATALELALPLYTLNVRHFQMIPGLAVMRPY